jgi:hypothetical protein
MVDMDEEVISTIDKESDKEEHMEIDKIKTNQSESPDILEPSVDKPTDTTKTWADETTDQEILKWIMPSDRRRRRQEKRPRERASSPSLNRKGSQSPSHRLKKR